MKYKIIKEKPIDEKVPIVLDSSDFWYCEKCKILYGRDETVLKDRNIVKGIEKNSNRYCPKHKEKSMSCQVLNYWEKDYEIEEIK